MTLAPSVPGNDATVVVQLPQSYTTLTSYGDFTGLLTITLDPSIPGPVATVVVNAPQLYTTVTSYGPFTSDATTTMGPSVPGAPATVFEQAPQSYTTVTSYEFLTSAATATLPPASQGGVATVLIQAPLSYTDITTYGAFTTAAITTMDPASEDSVATVVVQVPRSYDQPPRGDSGTVVVQVPQPYTTIFKYGSYTTGATTTMPPASQGDPATVIVQVKASYTTVTSYSNGFSGSSTSTGPVPTDCSPATVWVVLPAVGTQVADQTCDNAGLEYAIYTHNYYNSEPPYLSSFNAESFNTRLPTFTGLTDRIGTQELGGGTSGNPYALQSIYPLSPIQTWQYKVVNHRPFLYAPISGVYTIIVPYSDEITLVWFGNKAMTSWTRSNADLEQGYSWGPSASKTYKIQLTAGTYTPFRLLWANAQGDYGMIATVTASDGTVIVDGSGSKNDYFVRFTCDHLSLSFPSFGSGR
ncbi:agglutinin 2 [Fusarium phyllophilum]|uniref:Agglutinin 2 n=1 Tax=Fusarium phyllophilum TaxID=47803 RepID=A0A8H5KDW5_9HYPO|nr:agglutinin 2 [Fusarium phyllophilum]